ncbi:unnamed protein product [Camellia sinensis]
MTTLARKVYRDRDVRHHFDSFGWAFISQEFHLKGILQRIVSQLIPEKKEQLGQMIDEQLIKLLYEVQQKRKCLVVLDDIWSVDHWLRLSPAFPSTETGSRVVLTTWNKDVAALVGQNSLVHELNCINEEETWNLLEMKAIPRTYREWRSWEWKWLQDAGDETKRYGGGRDEMILDVLALSYQDLPYQLKSCFLHLAIIRKVLI